MKITKNSHKLIKKNPIKITAKKTISGPVLLHVFSDSTGELALHLVNTMLTQFPNGTFTVDLHNFVKGIDECAQVLEASQNTNRIVVHSLSKEDQKLALAELCNTKKVPNFDATGSFMNFLTQHANCSPEPGLHKVHSMDDEYFKRIKAMEYTLEHDDGLLLEDLPKADIVLVGVSRTSKTPISIYLANRGFRVSNVSLALHPGVQARLRDYSGKNVIGLTIMQSRLKAIRETRELVDGIPVGTYSDKDYILQELRMASDLFRSKSWPILDVSYASIEESAWKVIKLLNLATPKG